MNNRLMIVVETPTLSAGKYKEIFRNSFEIDTDLKYDYQSVINGLRCLFPDKQLIIRITVM